MCGGCCVPQVIAARASYAGKSVNQRQAMRMTAARNVVAVKAAVGEGQGGLEMVRVQ